MSDTLLTADERDDVLLLLKQMCEGTATIEVRDRLEETFRANPSVRQLAISYLSLHAELQWYYRGEQAISEESDPLMQPVACQAANPVILKENAKSLQAIPAKWFWRAGAVLSQPRLWTTLGVATALYGSFLFLCWNMLGERPDSDRFASSTVAQVIATEQVEWVQKPTSTDPKSLGRGEELSIESGMVELNLKQGAKLLVHGPATWSIDGDNQATLKKGKVVARVPKAAVGFVIETPSARLEDLGTEFGVEVAHNGQTQVHVLQGIVDISSRSYAAAKMASHRRLRAGEAAEASVDSASITETRFQAERFPTSIAAAKQTARPSTQTFMLNLAEAKATQSSVWHEDPELYSANRAIDRNPTTMAHTAGPDEAPWWQVDLGQSYPVAVVVLTNRPHFAGWLRDVQVSVLAEDGKTEVFKSGLLNAGNAEYGGERDFVHGPATLSCDLWKQNRQPAVGRFVRITRTACKVVTNESWPDPRPEVIAAAGNSLVMAEVTIYRAASEQESTNKVQ